MVKRCRGGGGRRPEASPREEDNLCGGDFTAGWSPILPVVTHVVFQCFLSLLLFAFNNARAPAVARSSETTHVSGNVIWTLNDL